MKLGWSRVVADHRPLASFFSGCRPRRVVQFSIVYFRGLGLTIGVRVWVRVGVRVWVRVMVRVKVRIMVRVRFGLGL